MSLHQTPIRWSDSAGKEKRGAKHEYRQRKLKYVVIFVAAKVVAKYWWQNEQFKHLNHPCLLKVLRLGIMMFERNRFVWSFFQPHEMHTPPEAAEPNHYRARGKSKFRREESLGPSSRLAITLGLASQNHVIVRRQVTITDAMWFELSQTSWRQRSRQVREVQSEVPFWV